MKHTALVLVASLAAIGSAHAQAWPNAAPSPYGGGAAAPATTAPQPASSAPSNQVELGTPPHALGTSAPSMPAASPAAASATGASPVPDADNPGGSRATTALNVLEAQGYTNFSDFRPNGSVFTALVNDGGQQFRVVINPDTGQISRQ